MVNPRTLQRLESRIQERAAYCLQFEIKDPRSSFVTITKVELDSDLKRGKIYWSCLGSAADRHKTESMLAGAAGFIQRQVARVLETRTVPHLAWFFDDSIEKAAELDRLISEARARDEALRPPSSEEP
jgi:ribosome-binding factor A